MIIVLELLDVIDEPYERHVPLVLDWEFFLEWKVLELILTDRLLDRPMPIFRHIQVVIWVLRVVHVVHIMVAVGFLVERTMVLDHLLVRKFVRYVLELQWGEELKVCLLDLVNYLFEFLFEVLLTQFLLGF